MTVFESRTGCGKCCDCKYHDMRDYKDYCTKPDNIRKGESRCWMNAVFAGSWHSCCELYED